jgi:hypothetical protein
MRYLHWAATRDTVVRGDDKSEPEPGGEIKRRQRRAASLLTELTSLTSSGATWLSSRRRPMA